jgi:hypothetical protein
MENTTPSTPQAMAQQSMNVKQPHTRKTPRARACDWAPFAASQVVLVESSCAQGRQPDGQAASAHRQVMDRQRKQLGHQGGAFACFTNQTQHCRSTLRCAPPSR